RAAGERLGIEASQGRIGQLRVASAGGAGRAGTHLPAHVAGEALGCGGTAAAEQRLLGRVGVVREADHQVVLDVDLVGGRAFAIGDLRVAFAGDGVVAHGGDVIAGEDQQQRAAIGTAQIAVDHEVPAAEVGAVPTSTEFSISELPLSLTWLPALATE